MTLWKVKD